MHRKSLALVATGLFLFAALFVQLTIVQAAPTQQNLPATEEPQPLPQPMRIQVHQLIPFTISIPAPLVGRGRAVTEALTSTAAITRGEALATGDVITGAGNAGDAFGDATSTLTATESTSAPKNETRPITAAAGISLPVIMTTVPVTLDLSLDLIVSDTLTTTVPASVTLQFADFTTTTVPVSITLAPAPDGVVVINLLPAPVTPTPTATATAAATEATAAATPTVTATATATLTPTATPAPSGLPAVNTTATVTANLRSGPATTFDIVGQVGPGQTVAIVAISEDGQWYLLEGGAWIANFLVAEQPANLPIATQAIIDQASGRAPVTTPVATATVTATTAVTTPIAATATPVPPVTAVTPTVSSNANLRAGPGTEFPVIGGTVTGQTLTIVGRNADGTWFRLDNTGWVFGELVNNPPALDTVPVVNADGTPIEPVAATPTPAAGSGLFPTPTPLAPGATGGTSEATTATPVLTPITGANATYLNAVQRVIQQYDQVLQTLDQLIAEGRSNSATLVNAAWGNRVNAAVTLLRQTSATVGELQAPTELTTLQQELVSAAQGYTTAANALSQAASTGAVAQLDAADTAIEQANTALTNAERALQAAAAQP